MLITINDHDAKNLNILNKVLKNIFSMFIHSHVTKKNCVENKEERKITKTCFCLQHVRFRKGIIERGGGEESY